MNSFSFGKVGNSGKSSTRAVEDESFTVENMPGAVAPLGFWDSLGLAAKAGEANENVLRSQLEAEVTHGCVAMFAALGFLLGEAVEGSSFLFDGSIGGPAIDHFLQTPAWADIRAATSVGAAEARRLEVGWVDPSDASYDQFGQLRDANQTGDIGFDPLDIRPQDPEELDLMIARELQNGRRAMLAAAGMMAQEAMDGLGILEHFQVSMIKSADFGL